MIIPDNDPAGIDDTIEISGQQTITDVNVTLNVTHTWVGDLRVTLTHVETGKTVTLIDRPGPAPNGCSGNDVDVVLDDQAAQSVQDSCGTDIGLSGRLRPSSALSAFNGESVKGKWRLNVADNASQDTGALVGWCLQVNSSIEAQAPVVTDFTCNGESDCFLLLDEPFELSFTFSDPDGNASAWRITAERDDGLVFDVDQGSIAPPAGSGTIPLNSLGFSCDTTCRMTGYTYSVVVTDATGLESTPRTVLLTVLGNTF